MRKTPISIMKYLKQFDESYNMLSVDDNYIEIFADIINDSNDGIIPSSVAEALWSDIRQMKCKEFRIIHQRKGPFEYVYRCRDGENDKDLLEMFRDEKVEEVHTIQ